MDTTKQALALTAISEARAALIAVERGQLSLAEECLASGKSALDAIEYAPGEISDEALIATLDGWSAVKAKAIRARH